MATPTWIRAAHERLRALALAVSPLAASAELRGALAGLMGSIGANLLANQLRVP